MNGRSGRNRLVSGLKAGLLTIGFVFLVAVGQTSEVEVQSPVFVDHTAETWQFGQVRGVNTSDIGVYGWTETSEHVAVYGQNLLGVGIKGVGNGGDGVQGFTTVPTATGVLGYSYVAPGTTGWSFGNDGLVGITTSDDPSHAAVRARNEGAGPAIVCEGNLVVTGEIQAQTGLDSCSQVASALEDLDRWLSESLASIAGRLEVVEVAVAPRFPDVEVTEDSGKRFFEFIEAVRVHSDLVVEHLQAIDPADEYMEIVYGNLTRFIQGTDDELLQVAALGEDLPQEALALLDEMVIEGAPEIVASERAVVGLPGGPPKFIIAEDVGKYEVIGTVLDKLGMAFASIPIAGGSLNALCKDLGDVFKGASEELKAIACLSMGQLELEMKLDGLIRGLFGYLIDPLGGETTLQKTLNAIPTNLLGEGMISVAANRESLTNLSAEVAKLEEKLCCLSYQLAILSEELGDALYGNTSAFSAPTLKLCAESEYGEPLIECFAGYLTTERDTDEEDVPTVRRAIKPEIEAIEKAVGELANELGQWTLPVDGEVGGCALTKKIYVYDEGTFFAENQDDAYEVLIETPAFDVSGWVDLTSLREGDSVSITVEVSVGNGPFRTWTETAFSGVQERGLKHFTEFTENLEQFVGTKVRVTIRQDASKDGFEVVIPVYYQFIVESQT